jgi:hypothetical protein
MRRCAGGPFVADRIRIIVSGMIAGDPFQGGATWAVLQYVLGLRRLGHDVAFVEPIAPASTSPDAVLADSTNAGYFLDVVRRFDLCGRAALLRQDTHDTVGMSYDALVHWAASADLLINISGMLRDPQLFDSVRRRVYLDLDPAFNQLWHAAEGIDVRFEGHTHFVTIGVKIGSPGCEVPTCGRTWIPTLQPIVLDEWPATPGNPQGAWTTVGNWRGYGSITYRGQRFGQKAHSLREFIHLPRRTQEQLVLALSIHPGEVNDLAALADNGWRLVNPADVTATPDDYQRFIQGSKAEFGIAKSGYVASRCGWFSDRSICYLASGRPVLAQDTGLAGILPSGEGLITFSTPDEAVAGIDVISSNYQPHANAARQLAEQYFDSSRVLGRLLGAVAQ